MDQKNGAGGVSTVAKEQGGQVGQTAAQAGGQVAQTTKEQATNVVGEAKQQARDLVGEARMQVSDQASTQKRRAVDGLRSLGDELQQMGYQDGPSGIAAEAARQAATRAHGLADHLDRYEPGELLDQVRSYARRRPVVFLTSAAVLGVLAGRLTRNLADSSGQPALPASTTTEPTYGGGFRPAAYEPAAGWQTGTSHQPVTEYDAPAYQAGYDAPDYRSAPDYPATPGYQAEPGYQPEHGYQSEPGYQPDYRSTPGAEATGLTPGDPIAPGSYEPEDPRRDDPNWRTP